MDNLEKYQYEMIRRQSLLSQYARMAGFEGAAENKNAYDSIKAVDGSNGFLYFVEYSPKNLDWDKANEYFKSTATSGGMCSGLFKNGLVLRQMDWNYDDEVEFIVKMNPDPDRGVLRSISVASCNPCFTRKNMIDLIQSGEYYDKFDYLPFGITDGINEKGIYVQTNVVYKNDVEDININPGKDLEFCVSTMGVRYILNNLERLENLQDLLNQAHIYTSKKFNKYWSHYMVCDRYNAKIVEFKEDSFEVKDFPLITNFRTNGGFDVQRDGYDYWHVKWNTVESNGMGVERWEKMADVAKLPSDPFTDPDYGQMADLRRKMAFTNCYTIRTEGGGTPMWLTDLNDGSLTTMDAYNCHSTGTITPAFQALSDSWYAKYTNRKRTDVGDNSTWQSTHSCIYDIPNKKFNIQIQEGLVDAKDWDVTLNGTITRNY